MTSTSVIKDVPTRRSTEELVPAFFEGAAPFLFMSAVWTTWTLVVPLLIMNNLWMTMIRDQEVANAMFVSGISYLVYSMMPFISGTINKGVSPSAAGPLINQSIKQSTLLSKHQPYHIKVKRVFVIINPYGGGKNNIERWDVEAQPVLTKAGIDCTICTTERQGHAHDIILNCALDGYDCIAVVGGDGTMNEVVNGLMKRPDGMMLPVALIPGGTGNALATDFGTLEFTKATNRIVHGSVVYMDLMLLTSASRRAPLHLYSIETITWGLVGNVAVESERAVMRILGTARFNACAVWGVMKGFLAKLTIHVEDPSFVDRSILPITWTSGQSIEQSNNQATKQSVKQSDNQTSSDQSIKQSDNQAIKQSNNQTSSFSGHFVTAYINNTQYFAKLLRGAPYALIDDGKFDLLFLDAASRAELLALFGSLPTGAHVNSSKVRYVQADHVRLVASGSGVLNVDGEVVEYEGEFQVRCVPRALPILLETQFTARDVPGLKESM